MKTDKHLLLLLFCIFTSFEKASSSIASVLIFGYRADNPRPVFPKLEKAEFQSVLKELKDKFTFVTFLDDTISPENLLCANRSSNDCYGGTVANKFTFFSGVEDPLQTLFEETDIPLNIAVNEGAFVVDDLDCDSLRKNNLFLIRSQKRPSDVAALQRFRTNAMRNFSGKIQNCLRPALYFFFGESKNPLLVTKTAALRMSRVTLEEDGDILEIETKSMSMIVGSDIIIFSVVTSDSSIFPKLYTEPVVLKMKVEKSKGYSKLIEAEYHGLKFHSVGGPIRWRDQNTLASESFILRSGRTILRINNFELQLLNYPADMLKISHRKNEKVYFTPGILQGLFVSAILLAIGFIGVAWIYDISACDRFDDPELTKRMQFSKEE